MHAAIGRLASGRYYAFVDGYQAEPTYADSPVPLERLLRGEAGPGQVSVEAATEVRPSPRRRVRTLKAYRVSVQLKYPSATHAGCELALDAYTQKDAIRQAREQVRTQVLYDRHDGPLIYEAYRVDG
jgi:hypothetical protein